MTNFDLNIEKVLEDWEVAHALREVIANAIDEKLLQIRKIFVYTRMIEVIGVLEILEEA